MDKTPLEGRTVRVGDLDVIGFLNNIDKAVFIESDTLFLKDGRYEIPLCEMDTPIKLLSWVHHLSKKGWCANYIITRIIDIVTERNSIKLYQNNTQA